MSSEPRDGGEGSGLLGQRMRVALIVLTVFGLPMALMLTYLAMRSLAFRPPFDIQPGGALEGVVLGDDGEPLGTVPVDAFLFVRDTKPVLHEHVETDSNGAFSIDVPALDGCYVVRAGGGIWAEVSREVSLADDEAPNLEFTLIPGSELTLTLSRIDGRPIRGGRYQLMRQGGVFGLPIPSAAIMGEFTGATLVRGGLEPGTWDLKLMIEDGTVMEDRLDLPPGRTALAVEPY